MAHGSEKVRTRGVREGEALSCWWFSQLTQDGTARPHPSVCPAPCLRTHRWRAFPTPPWGPQVENEGQPWHFLPSLRLPRVGGQGRSCKDWGRLISFTETGTGGGGPLVPLRLLPGPSQ